MLRPVLFASWAVLAVLANGNAWAENAPDRLDILQSEWFANRSGETLVTADRAGAILMALRGIPSDPVENDVDTYASAFDALYRAVASRAFRADVSFEQVVFWNPDGSLAVTADFNHQRQLPGIGAMRLWSTQTGRIVADLGRPAGYSAFPGVGDYSETSPFSPDGRFLAVNVEPGFPAQSFGGSLQIRDGRTGIEIANLPGERIGGFSRDSDLFLAMGVYGNELRLYQTGTWQTVVTIRNEQVGGQVFSLGFPGADNAFYLFTYDLGDPQRGATTMWRLDRTGLQAVVSLDELFGAERVSELPYVTGSLEAPVMALPLLDGSLVILSLDGTVLGTVPDIVSSLAATAFVRGGAAIAVQHFTGFAGSRRPDPMVYALDGTPLEPQSQDSAPFLDWMANPRGIPVGVWGSHARVFPERVGTATGLALYAEIWPQIPQALRDQIQTDRVTRP